MDLEKSVQTLSEQGIILYPTDTVWGLGCDATNENAVAKIFRIKKRSESKSLIILVSNLEMLSDYVEEIPNFILDFIKKIEEPTTIIYKNPKNLAKNVISADNSVAIRLVKDDFCIKMIENFGKPIVSTSANISGEPTPHFFKEISTEIIQQCDYVMRHRQEETQKRQSSRLIRFDENGNIEHLR